MHTCRFCKQDHKRQRMFKYAARHWAHYDCWLAAKGMEIVEPGNYRGLLAMLQAGLHGWQLRDFPVFRLADWMEAHRTNSPGRSWVDKACWTIKKAIQLSEEGVKV